MSDTLKLPVRMNRKLMWKMVDAQINQLMALPITTEEMAAEMLAMAKEDPDDQIIGYAIAARAIERLKGQR